MYVLIDVYSQLSAVCPMYLSSIHASVMFCFPLGVHTACLLAWSESDPCMISDKTSIIIYINSTDRDIASNKGSVFLVL